MIAAWPHRPTPERLAALTQRRNDRLAALAAPNMSPVLGRYMDRSWSHGIGHRLYDTDGRAYLDFANGIAVTHGRLIVSNTELIDRSMNTEVSYATMSFNLRDIATLVIDD